jgi:hypothetical protein
MDRRRTGRFVRQDRLRVAVEADSIGVVGTGGVIVVMLWCADPVMES